MPNAQVAAKISMQPCKSMISIKIGNAITMPNADKHMKLVAIVRPNDRTFDGKISTKQINDKGIMPTDEIKMTNPKLVTGTQVNIGMSNPMESQ